MLPSIASVLLAGMVAGMLSVAPSALGFLTICTLPASNNGYLTCNCRGFQDAIWNLSGLRYALANLLGTVHAALSSKTQQQSSANENE